MKRRLTLLLLMLAGTAVADPMRPFVLPASPAASAPAPSRAAASTSAGERPWPALVAIRTEADGTRRALIGDQWHGSGARIGSTQISSIAATSVVVSRGGQRSTLHLLPTLQASTATPSPAAGGGALAEGSATPRTAPAQRPTRAPTPRQP